MKAKITLNYPVQLADKLLKEVEMRRPTLGDRIDNPILGEHDVLGESIFIAHLCSLNPEDMRLLDYFDYEVLQNQLIRFRLGRDEQKTDNKADVAV